MKNYTLTFVFAVLALAACGGNPALISDEDILPNGSLSDAEPVSVTEVALENATLALKPGQAGQLRLNVSLSNGSVFRDVTGELSTPYGLSAEVKWFSEDEEVVTVDGNGRLLGTGEGETTVKGSVKNRAVLATVTVTAGSAVLARLRPAASPAGDAFVPVDAGLQRARIIRVTGAGACPSSFTCVGPESGSDPEAIGEW